MKKTKSAVRYGMEVLKLSPDELFKLIESSQGYDGEDYSRWLAGKIIEVAEADGVQFSQLLVRKFNIINEILEEVSEGQEISEGFLDIFKRFLGSDLYSVGVGGIGEALDVDWYSGLDLNEDNSFFVKEKLPVDLRDRVLENRKTSILFRLSLDGADKKSDLYVDAKGQGLVLGSRGAMILYRLCSMVSHFDLSEFRFGVLVPVKFLYDSANANILDYMLSFFNIDRGYSIKSVEMSLNALNSGDMAFIVLSPKVAGSVDSDGIVLSSISLDSDELSGFSVGSSRRYSRSCRSMISYIRNCVRGDSDCDVYGYLCVGAGRVEVSSYPCEGLECIPICDYNIRDIIAYYGVTVAKEVDWGYSSDITCLIDGVSGYEELLYNCLPLFLFDVGSSFRAGGSLDVLSSPVIGDLLDIGMPYFSFEAKELFNLCRDYLEFSVKNAGITDKSFQELRVMSDNGDFNRMYESKLISLKEYVSRLSKGYL